MLTIHFGGPNPYFWKHPYMSYNQMNTYVSNQGETHEKPMKTQFQFHQIKGVS